MAKRTAPGGGTYPVGAAAASPACLTPPQPSGRCATYRDRGPLLFFQLILSQSFSLARPEIAQAAALAPVPASRFSRGRLGLGCIQWQRQQAPSLPPDLGPASHARARHPLSLPTCGGWGQAASVSLGGTPGEDTAAARPREGLGERIPAQPRRERPPPPPASLPHIAKGAGALQWVPTTRHSWCIGGEGAPTAPADTLHARVEAIGGGKRSKPRHPVILKAECPSVN